MPISRKQINRNIQEFDDKILMIAFKHIFTSTKSYKDMLYDFSLEINEFNLHPIETQQYMEHAIKKIGSYHANKTAEELGLEGIHKLQHSMVFEGYQMAKQEKKPAEMLAAAKLIGDIYKDSKTARKLYSNDYDEDEEMGLADQVSRIKN